MTRKDYILIAGVLKDVRNLHPQQADLLDEIAREFAVRLVNDNDKFDAARFFAAACAMKGKTS